MALLQTSPWILSHSQSKVLNKLISISICILQKPKKKTPVKKTPKKRTPSKKTPAKKTPAKKKTPARKTTPKKKSPEIEGSLILQHSKFRY